MISLDVMLIYVSYPDLTSKPIYLDILATNSQHAAGSPWAPSVSASANTRIWDATALILKFGMRHLYHHSLGCGCFI